jgi:putative transposase
MPDIITISICLAPLMNRTTLKVMQQLIEAVLSSSGRVTMVGLSRWTGKGCSYRTIQRFFGKQRDWGALLWAVVEAHLVKENRVWLLAADEVVVSKAGTATYGKERFYSSLVGRPIGAVSFLAAAVVDVTARKPYPVQIEQRLPVPKVEPAKGAPTKRGRGRECLTSRNYEVIDESGIGWKSPLVELATIPGKNKEFDSPSQGADTPGFSGQTGQVMA